MKRILIIALLVLAVQSAWAGGPWTQPKGNGYFKLAAWGIIYNQHFNAEGALEANLTSSYFNTSVYGEYGLTDRLTAVVNFPFFAMSSIQEGVILTDSRGNNLDFYQPSLISLGDTDIGLKYALNKGKYPVALTVIAGVPLGKTSYLGGGFITGESIAPTAILQNGDGEFNQMILLDAGHGFTLGTKPAYVSTTFGFNNRTNGFSDELRFNLEGGVNLMNQKLWLIARLGVLESLKNGSLPEQGHVAPGIFANNTEYVSLTLEAGYYLTQKMGVSVNVAPAFRAENIAAAPTFSAGVFFDMKR